MKDEIAKVLCKRERNTDNDHQFDENKRQRRDEIIKIKGQGSYPQSNKYGLDLRKRLDTNDGCFKVTIPGVNGKDWRQIFT